MPQEPTFGNLYAAGFTALIPITPHDGIPSPSSVLSNNPKALGKSPGVKNSFGQWHGFDWRRHDTTPQDLEAWGAMGAGIGIRTGHGLLCIDADTLDPKQAETVLRLAVQHLGEAPLRVGKPPKFAMLYRTHEPDLRLQRVHFSAPDGKENRVEILAEGQQFVAAGIHPETGKPYRWIKPLPDSIDDLPVITQQDLDAFTQALLDTLPNASMHRTASSVTDRASVDQQALIGDTGMVRKAVKALPNSLEAFPTYEDYVRVGAAIKAATQDDPDEGLQLFLQWAARFDGKRNGDAYDIDVYNRIKPPFEIGANWLYDHAHRLSDGKFNLASVWFDEIPASGPADQTELNPFDEQTTKPPANPIVWHDPAEWAGLQPKERKFIVDGILPAGEVTLLTGSGGVGKTLLAQQITSHVAANIPVFGHNVLQSRSMLFLCEDDIDELHRRQVDICNALLIDVADLSAYVRISSRKFADNILVTFPREAGGVAQRTALFAEIMNAAQAFEPGILVLDTISDIFGGNEIDRSHVRQFIQAGIGQFSAATGCATLALGHPSRAGESSGEGTSGSTAWHNTVRSRLYLERLKKDEASAYRKLTAKKANYGPAGGVYTLMWKRGYFDLVASTVSSADAAGVGENGADGSARSGVGGGQGRLIREAVLYAVRLCAAEERKLSASKNSSYYAPKVLAALQGVGLDAFTQKEIEPVFEQLAGEGAVVEVVFQRTERDRHPARGLAVAEEEPAGCALFD